MDDKDRLALTPLVIEKLSRLTLELQTNPGANWEAVARQHQAEPIDSGRQSWVIKIPELPNKIIALDRNFELSDTGSEVTHLLHGIFHRLFPGNFPQYHFELSQQLLQHRVPGTVIAEVEGSFIEDLALDELEKKASPTLALPQRFVRQLNLPVAFDLWHEESYGKEINVLVGHRGGTYYVDRLELRSGREWPLSPTLDFMRRENDKAYQLGITQPVYTEADIAQVETDIRRLAELGAVSLSLEPQPTLQAA